MPAAMLMMRFESGDRPRFRELRLEIEEAADSDVHDSDKAWEALHRTFSNGTFDVIDGDPLTHCFFGERILSEDGQFVAMLTPSNVAVVAGLLSTVTEVWLRARYFSMQFPDYKQGQDEDDFAYTWACFQGLPEFFARARAAGRYVIFVT